MVSPGHRTALALKALERFFEEIFSVSKKLASGLKTTFVPVFLCPTESTFFRSFFFQAVSKFNSKLRAISLDFCFKIT